MTRDRFFALPFLLIAALPFPPLGQGSVPCALILSRMTPALQAEFQGRLERGLPIAMKEAIGRNPESWLEIVQRLQHIVQEQGATPLRKDSQRVRTAVVSRNGDLFAIVVFTGNRDAVLRTLEVAAASPGIVFDLPPSEPLTVSATALQ